MAKRSVIALAVLCAAVAAPPSAQADGAFEIITFLLPAAQSVEEIEVPGGRGFEVRSEHSRDLLIVKGVEYTWRRTRAGGGEPEEISFSSADYTDPVKQPV